MADFKPRTAPRGPRPESVKAAISASLRAKGIKRSLDYRARVAATKSIGKRGIDCTEAAWDAVYVAKLARIAVISGALEDAGL